MRLLSCLSGCHGLWLRDLQAVKSPGWCVLCPGPRVPVVDGAFWLSTMRPTERMNGLKAGLAADGLPGLWQPCSLAAEQ